MKKIIENIVACLGIIVFIAIIYSQFGEGYVANNKTQKVSFSEFLDSVHSGMVDRVTMEGSDVHEIVGTFKDGTHFKTRSIPYTGLISDLRNNNVSFEVDTGESVLGVILSMLFSWMPMFLLIGVWIFFMKQMQSGGNKTMNFGKSRAKMTSDKKNKVTFADVAGIDEAKEELIEIVDFLKNPRKFQVLGGEIPKGCLLVGAPGTGKTLLARAIAGEAKVPFFIISGSDFVEMFVGVGASRVRDMFDKGKKNAPCIIFIDEIDAVGRHRGVGFGGGNDEREQTLNQLLVEMDGFEANDGVIIVAATNRPDVLDPALLRPGRFDRQIIISLPDIAGREKIIEVHIKKLPISPDVNIKIVARGTPGFSGADLANLVNEAALIAARKNKKVVTMDDFEYARDKVMMGAERRSLIMRDEEKRLTAYHEAGHAIVAIMLPASDPIHKATIIPRGRSLGLVMRVPEHDRVSLTREKMYADLAVAMAGRVAEEVIFGYDKVTSGASSDLKQATELAILMVSHWGMSDKVGSVYYEEQHHNLISDDAKRICNDEVRRILEEVKSTSRDIIERNINKLHIIAKSLLEYETLTGDEIKDLIEGRKIRENDFNEARHVKKSSISSEGSDEE